MKSNLILKTALAIGVALASGNAFAKSCTTKLQSVYVNINDSLFVYGKSADGSVNYNQLRVCDKASEGLCKSYLALLVAALEAQNSVTFEAVVGGSGDACKVDSQLAFSDIAGGKLFSVRIHKD